MPDESLMLGLLLAALVIATFLYGQLIRRRHSLVGTLHRNMDAIADNYGRSGLP